MKTRLAICAVMVALSSFASLSENAKVAVRSVVDLAEKRIAEASVLGDKAITILPVKGDEDGYCERLLTGAFIKAGRTCVISNDEKNDERFRRILKEIMWDERQTMLKSIDPATADEIGRLKSTQILIEARLDISYRGRKKRAFAELNLLAYSIETKQYIWTVNLAFEEARTGAAPTASDFNVEVAVNAEEEANGVSGIVSSDIRNAVAGYGFKVNAEGEKDLVLKVAFTRETFDKSGEYYIFKGAARARLTAAHGDGILYEKTFEAKGARGLGVAEADRNLARELSIKILTWLDETLAPRALFIRHPDFVE